MTRLIRAVVVAVLLASAGCGATPQSEPADRPRTGTHQEPPLDVDSEDLSPAVSAAPSNVALLAAHTYIRRWARPSLERIDWYAGVRSWVTPAYAQLLADTDPANVPAHVVVGAPVPVSSTTAVLVADVPTDAGQIRVTVVKTAGRWLIAAARPAEAS